MNRQFGLNTDEGIEFYMARSPIAKRANQSVTTRHSTTSDQQHDTNLRTLVLTNSPGSSIAVTPRGHITQSYTPPGNDLELLRKDNVLLYKTNEELKILIKELQVKLQQTRDELSSSRIPSRSQEEYLRLESQYSSLKQNFEELSLRNSTLSSERDQLERNLSTLTAELSAQIAVLRSEREKESAIQARQYITDIAGLRERQVSSEAHLSILEAKMKDKDSEMARILDELEKTKIDRDSAMAQENGLRSEVESLRIELATQTAKLEQLPNAEAELQRMDATIRRLEAELAAKMTLISFLEQKRIEELHRATAPLIQEINSLKAFNTQIRLDTQKAVHPQPLAKVVTMVEESSPRPVLLNQIPMPDTQRSEFKIYEPLKREPFHSEISTQSTIGTLTEAERLRNENNSLRSELLNRIEANEQSVKTINTLVKHSHSVKRL